MKIQKRLLLSILPVVFVTVMAVTLIAISISTDAMEVQVKDNAELLSRSYSSQLNSRVIQIKRSSRDIASAIVTAVNVETVIIDARKRYTEMDRIFYTSLDGSIKDMSPYSRTLLGNNYSNDLDWQQAIKDKKTVLSNPLEYLGSRVLFVYTPVIIDYVANKNSEVIGVVIIVISESDVFKDIHDVVYGETGSVFVINRDGQFVSHKDHSYVMEKRVVDIPASTGLTKIENSMKAMHSGLASYYDGPKKHFLSFSPVPEANWSLSLTGDYGEFTRDIDSLVKFNILILFVGILFATVIIYLIVSGVVKPITILTDMAGRISQGDMSSRSKLTTKNEMGILSKAVDGMVDRLEDYNKTLEADVQERTKEIQAANEELTAMNETMEAMNEELTVTNESLDHNSREVEAMNEELKVTNEALDDKNREFEAMNEELSATVEELDSANRQLLVTKDALWSEMELAQKLQTVLLPKEPKIAGFEISAYMSTTDRVGGDYYDVINVDGKDWFLIGDVSGHGVTAGLIMMMVQTSIHVALSHNPHSLPGDLLTIINKTVHSNISKLGGNRYMTLTVFACLDDDKFSFAGAHLPVIIYRNETKSLEMLETPGAWIGLIDDVHGLNDNGEFNLYSGDIVLLYTDGISEAVTASGTQYSQKALAELFMDNVDQDAKGICNVIKDFSHQLVVDDDVTIMVLKKVSNEV
ncbi:MAG: SpoIIE family protein phosphatase [Spirochaetaceae bacterium]